MFDLFLTLFYQPVLNALVLFYWLVSQTPIGPDMGVAVILMTIMIRLLLLPLTIASFRTEKERRSIEERVKSVKEMHSSDPVKRKSEVKRVLRAQPRILISEGVMFFVQLIIALVLWRIFATGLKGQDLHLLYSWVPEVAQPYNLQFLGRYDLTHSDLTLNLIQTLLIFVVESLSVLNSPSQVSRYEALRVQIILPLVSFFIFAFLPAGKKLFVITTLSFSLLVLGVQLSIRAKAALQRRFAAPEVS